MIDGISLTVAGGTTCLQEAMATYLEGHCPGCKGPLEPVNELITKCPRCDTYLALSPSAGSLHIEAGWAHRSELLEGRQCSLGCPCCTF